MLAEFGGIRYAGAALRLRLTALYMPAVVAMRHNPILSAFAGRLRAAGKPGRVTICAVMRKLMHIVYGVLRSRKPFISTPVAAM